MPYSTYVPSEDLDRPQRTALQRALEAMTPPGLVQQGGMLRERFDALGPVRAAARTAEDLTGLFGRLGPIGLGDVLNPAGLGARAGAAAGRAVAESEAGVEAELRAGETLARAGPAVRERIGQVGAELLPRVVPDERQPGGERVELGGITRLLPLPPGLEGMRPGVEGYVEDLASAGRYVAQRPREVAAAVDTAAGFMPGRFLTRTLPRVARGEGRQVLGELGQALPALGAAGTLVPLPAVQAGNLVANAVEEPLLRQGVNPALAGAAGLAADVLTPSPGDIPRIGARLPRVAADLTGLARRGLDRFGQAAAEEAVDAAAGVRRGQQIRIPPLTPEQQVQRAADGAAEQRVFDAIRSLWRRGPAGEEIADELRFLSVGKGEAGEAAARELLASRGLEDVLPPPTAAGVVAETPVAGEGVLGLARRATEPLGAAAARTPGERAFDLASGTAGGVVGAATAPDATWQERVGRGALGASLGALGGANLRQLGRVGRGALGTGDEALGVAAGRAATQESDLARAAREARGEPPPPLEPLEASGAPGSGRSGWGVAGDILTSAPLLRPSSLLTNLLGGAVRTFQRWGEESAGAAWVDRAGKESLADLLGMASEAPGAVRDLWKVFRQGGTSAVRGQLGAQSGSLVTEPGWGPMLLTAGTRANLAPDAGWARINAAGAKARAAARGITDPDDVSFLAERSSDFATFAGKASKLTEYLGGFRETLKDPDASGAQKAWALGMVGITPYLRMPERFMAATGRVVLDPAMLGYSRFTKNGLVRQAVEGNQDAQREVAGRLTMSGLAYTLGLGAFAGGQLYGAPPKDAKQRRQMEAAGVRFNTIFGVDTKKLGNFGQAMSAMGTALTAAQRKYEQGADGSDVVRAFFSEAWRWGLEESFLRGLSDFDVAIRAGRGFEHAEKVAADTVTRPLSGIAGYVDPWDPYERERRGTANELLEGLPGGRFLMPTRVDPATGEAVRRRGSGLGRMFFGNQGRVESPEARELALRGVTAREFQPADTVYGHVQTPAGRRALQETFGRYTRDYVRDTMARPDYQGATPEEQTATLRRQVGLAQQLADIEVGDKVARDPQARFELEWLRTPHYRGVEGTPDRVARQNLEIREAKQLLDEYQRRYGETPGRHRFYDEHPALIDLARRPELPERRLAEEKEAVRRRTGAPETRDTALLGAGNLIVPTPGFTAP